MMEKQIIKLQNMRDDSKAVCTCPECGRGVYYRGGISMDINPPILCDTYACSACDFGFSISSWEGFGENGGYRNRVSIYKDFEDKYTIEI